MNLQANRVYRLDLTGEEVVTVLRHLGRGAYDEVAPLVAQIGGQVQQAEAKRQARMTKTQEPTAPPDKG